MWCEATESWGHPEVCPKETDVVLAEPSVPPAGALIAQFE